MYLYSIYESMTYPKHSKANQARKCQQNRNPALPEPFSITSLGSPNCTPVVCAGDGLVPA